MCILNWYGQKIPYIIGKFSLVIFFVAVINRENLIEFTVGKFSHVRVLNAYSIRRGEFVVVIVAL